MKICACGHQGIWHRHYSRSTDCAHVTWDATGAAVDRCSCRAFRKQRGWRRLLRSAT